MRQLTSSHRQALSETILRDRTVNQAAATLGIPGGTVKSRVYYALRELHEVLAAHEQLPQPLGRCRLLPTALAGR